MANVSSKITLASASCLTSRNSSWWTKYSLTSPTLQPETISTLWSVKGSAVLYLSQRVQYKTFSICFPAECRHMHSSTPNMYLHSQPQTHNILHTYRTCYIPSITFFLSHSNLPCFLCYLTLTQTLAACVCQSRLLAMCTPKCLNKLACLMPFPCTVSPADMDHPLIWDPKASQQSYMCLFGICEDHTSLSCAPISESRLRITSLHEDDSWHSVIRDPVVTALHTTGEDGVKFELFDYLSAKNGTTLIKMCSPRAEILFQENVGCIEL